MTLHQITARRHKAVREIEALHDIVRAHVSHAQGVDRAVVRLRNELGAIGVALAEYQQEQAKANGRRPAEER